jgi:hypothetical protein
MRRCLFAAIVLIAAMSLGGSVQKAELSAPPDVATSNWLPLGESFGFVIVNAGKTTKPKQPAQPALFGYFPHARHAHWLSGFLDRSMEQAPNGTQRSQGSGRI